MPKKPKRVRRTFSVKLMSCDLRPLSFPNFTEKLGLDTMEEAKFTRLASLSTEHVLNNLGAPVDSAVVEVIDHCSVEEVGHLVGERVGGPFFKATLTLQYKKATSDLFKKEGIDDMVPKSVTLIINNEEVTDTLFPGVDFFPEKGKHVPPPYPPQW